MKNLIAVEKNTMNRKIYFIKMTNITFIITQNRMNSIRAYYI